MGQALFTTLVTFALWIGSLLLLRLTPLTGAVFLLASFGLTFCLALLGWSVLTLLERRHRAR